MKSFRTPSFDIISFTDMDSTISRKVWECRNLPEIRKWMTNDKPISYESHQNFVHQLNSVDNRLYFCVLQGGVLLGSINFHFENTIVAERGIYLNPEYIGKGLAKKICKELYSYFRDKKGLRQIKTKVKKENVSSNALEASLGAELIDEDDDYFYYVLDLTTNP